MNDFYQDDDLESDRASLLRHGNNLSSLHQVILDHRSHRSHRSRTSKTSNKPGNDNSSSLSSYSGCNPCNTTRLSAAS